MSEIILKWTQKTTFTIQNNFAEKLNSYKNKSKIINSALNLYFEREKFLDKDEKEFFEIVTDKNVVETINKVNWTKSNFLTFW